MLKRIKCRDHGGFFMVESRRGRPPVRCTEENECDAQKVPSAKTRTGSNAVAVAMLTAGRAQMAESGEPSKTRTSAVTAAPESASATGGRANWVERKKATTREVNRIFHLLAERGWEVKRSWLTDDTADLVATRDEEMAYYAIRDGKVIHEQYSLWSFDKPSLNGKPAHNLPFDPEEIGDRELVRVLAGMKIKWYNRLSGKEEEGFCGTEVRVEHCFNGKGDEVPGERIIKFIDPDRKHFMAFRLDQLLKVGK